MTKDEELTLEALENVHIDFVCQATHQAGVLGYDGAVVQKIQARGNT